MVRSAPIVVANVTVGRVDAIYGFRPLLQRTGLLALFGAVLGLAVYFAVRIFPLRVLDRALNELRRTERNLVRQNERFDAALTNMLQGLCMFDAEAELRPVQPSLCEDLRGATRQNCAGNDDARFDGAHFRFQQSFGCGYEGDVCVAG